jgi:hypothetical protein
VSRIIHQPTSNSDTCKYWNVKIGLPVVWWRHIYLINDFCCEITCLKWPNHICCVMFSMLASSAVDCGFESRSGQTKDYKIGICCLSTKRAALRSKSKNWLAQNQDYVWNDMAICRLLFQWASTIKIQLSVHVLV